MLIVAAVFGSLVPSHELPQIHASDKVQHMGAYALLALWFAGIYPKSRYLVIGALLAALGLAIEGAQQAMQYGRQADLYDLGANVAGILVGLIAASLGLGNWALRLEQLVRR